MRALPTRNVEAVAAYYELSSDEMALADGRVPNDILTMLQQNPEMLSAVRALGRNT